MKIRKEHSNLLRSAAVLLASGFMSACAFGPLVLHESARTVGESNHELIAGVANAGYSAKWTVGIAKDWDFGLQLESLSVGVRIKHAFVNSAAGGWSFAGAAGVGSSVGGSHFYGDLVLSHLNGWWEPYGAFRVVHVNMDPIEARDADTGQLAFTIDRSEYNYGQLIVGSRFWFSPAWMLTLEISSLTSLSSGLNFSSPTIASVALGARF